MNKDVGKKIREIRLLHNMSQNELASRAGIAISTLSYIENGRKLPQFNTLSAICRGLNTTVLELLSFNAGSSEYKLFEQANIPGHESMDRLREFEKYIFKKLLSETGNCS